MSILLFEYWEKSDIIQEERYYFYGKFHGIILLI